MVISFDAYNVVNRQWGIVDYTTIGTFQYNFHYAEVAKAKAFHPSIRRVKDTCPGGQHMNIMIGVELL